MTVFSSYHVNVCFKLFYCEYICLVISVQLTIKPESIFPIKYVLYIVGKKFPLVLMCLYTPLLFSLIVFYPGSYTVPQNVVSEHLIHLSTYQGELCQLSLHCSPSHHIKVYYTGSGCTYSLVTNWF